MSKLKIEYIDIDKLIPYINNPRINDNAVEKVASSIKNFGFKNPIIIDKDNEIIAGHTRLKAARKLGLEEVPTIKVEDLTEQQIKAFRIADNKTSEFAEWDMELLEIELEGLDDIFTGFDLDELDKLFDNDNEVVEDDFEVEVPEEPISKRGDIWLLGKHRLMCGDSTSINDVEKLMNGNKADMVFTDPPYRMETQGGINQWVGQQASKLGESIKDLCDFEPDEFLKRLEELFNKKMNAYIFCNKDLVPDYLNWGLKNGYAFNILFWKKPNALPLGGQHRPDLEYLLFFRKGAIWNNGLEGVSYSKCLEFGRDNSTSHPTTKPLELIGNELKISSNENSNVVDLFGGSGSTLIASEQLNRICYMMELDEKYVDVIVNRYIEFKESSKDIYLIRGGVTFPYSEVV